MAAKKRTKKGVKKSGHKKGAHRKGTHKKAKKSRAKGHIPMKVLEKRLTRLNNVVKARGGKHF